jgi:hypothetical protein
MEAIQSLPESNLSATLRKRYLLSFIVDVKVPSGDISENLFNKPSLGILTLVNFNLPLSTPFSPNLEPISSIYTPLLKLPSAFLTLTKNA